jgi:YVTN family beta-propeller protein
LVDWEVAVLSREGLRSSLHGRGGAARRGRGGRGVVWRATRLLVVVAVVLGVFAVAAAAAGGGPALPCGSSSASAGVVCAPEAFVANRTSNSVTVLNSSTGAVVTTLTTGFSQPSAVAVTPDGKTAYVTNSGSGTVTPITVATNTPGSPITVGSNPYAVAVTPDGKTAYVTNEGSGTVTPITVATNTPGSPITVGSDPEGVAVTPDGKTAYVANLGDGTVTPITVATNTAGSPITVGSNPYGVAVAPAPQTVYVTNSSSGTVTPIAVATNTAGTAIGGFSGPHGVAVTPDGQTVYVVNNAGSVQAVNVATGALEGAAINVGSAPQGIAITPDGQTAYVANGNSNTVTPITLASNPSHDTVGTAIPVGSEPRAIAITPDGQTAYVTNQVSGTVTPITVATNSAGTPITVSGGAFAIAITPNGQTAYVAAGTSVTPITLASNPSDDTVGTAITVGSGANAVAITPDGKTAYVDNDSPGTVTPINVATNTAGTPITLGGSTGFALAVTPDGNTAYTTINADAAVPINLATGAVGTSVTVGTNPYGVAIVGPLEIGNDSTLPQQAVGTPYSQQLWSVAGTSPFTYEVTNGSLPAGLTLSSSGLISGTPTQVVNASFTVAVTDSSSERRVAVKAFTLNVTDTLTGIGSFPTGMAVDNASDQVWVAASGSNQVTTINAATNAPTVGSPLSDPSSSLNFPANLVYDPANTTLFAANFFGGGLTALQTAGGSSPASPITLAGCAEPAGETLISGSVYVACGTSGQIYAVNASSGATSESAALGSGAITSGVADSGTPVSAGNPDLVLVADASGASLLDAVNPTTLALDGTPASLPAGATAATVAVYQSGSNSVANTAYVADPGTSQVSIVDIEKNADGSFKGFGAPSTVPDVPAGCVPYGVAVGPENNTLVVSCSALGEALVYDISDIAGGTPDAPVLLETIPVGNTPDEVAIANGGNTGLAFISNEADNTVSVIDPPVKSTAAVIPLAPSAPGWPSSTTPSAPGAASPTPTATTPAVAPGKTSPLTIKKKGHVKHKKTRKHRKKHKAARDHTSLALIRAQARVDPLLAPVNGHTVR